jgi:hypothetical protein
MIVSKVKLFILVFNKTNYGTASMLSLGAKGKINTSKTLTMHKNSKSQNFI